MGDRTPAAILTVGTELVTGQRIDTNTAEIALALTSSGYAVAEAVSAPDDERIVADAMARLTSTYPLVVVTGGLGPTHDDVTREAAARALGLALRHDADIHTGLEAAVARHARPDAASQVYRQADVLDGATVIPAVCGTAPGQIVPTPSGSLVLLPGPPSEMRPMLGALPPGRHSFASPETLRCVGITESDAQRAAQAALGQAAGIGLTLLAKPSLVDVILFDEGAGEGRLRDAANAVAEALGDACYSRDGATLAEVVVGLAKEREVMLACAESCTGGLIAAAITEVPGSSAVFVGGVVAYANAVKTALLGVEPATLTAHGAVSEQTACRMAEGALSLGATMAVSTTGIAGPDGGSPDKPVGTVWIGIATADVSSATVRRFPGHRAAVRARAATYALDAVRRALTAL